MASVHVYVRVQTVAANEAVQSVVAAVAHLRSAVEAAGGEWKGEAQAVFDADVIVTPVSEPAPEALSEPVPEAHDDTVPPDVPV